MNDEIILPSEKVSVVLNENNKNVRSKVTELLSKKHSLPRSVEQLVLGSTSMREYEVLSPDDDHEDFDILGIVVVGDLLRILRNCKALRTFW